LNVQSVHKADKNFTTRGELMPKVGKDIRKQKEQKKEKGTENKRNAGN
jgi:hypothetical protein